MTQLILHHFDASPFAEKVRVALGIKGLSWQSVQIPMVMPKPDLTLLTGGYRKTPVLQIGADIYCDTQRIASELDARCEGPQLLAGSAGALAETVAAWSDRALFQPGAGLSMGTNLDLPEAVLADRFAFFDFLDREQLSTDMPHFFAQFRTGLQRIEDMLADGRAYLLGSEPCWADAACYAPVWMCRGNIVGSDQLLGRLPLLQQWEQRMLAQGHGERNEISAQDAHDVAHSSTSQVAEALAPDCWPQLTMGTAIEVTPDDYGAVPVQGELARLTQHDIAIRRTDPRVGDVVVHFPRSGYRITTL
jgi:glutathione S-transferase